MPAPRPPLFNFNWKKNAKNSLNISSGFLGNRPQSIRKKENRTQKKRNEALKQLFALSAKFSIEARVMEEKKEEEEERVGRLYRIQRSVAILPQVRHRLFYAVPFCSDGLY